MLATPTILMSLGTDQASASPVLSGRSDSATPSFAQSFNEGSALMGIDGTQAEAAGGNTSKDGVDTETAVPEKNVNVLAILADIKAKGDVRAGGKIQDESSNTKVLTDPPANSKGPGSISGKGTITANGGLHRHGGHSKENISASTKVEVPDDQLSSGDVKNVAQGSIPDAVDGAKTGVTDGTVTPQPIVATSEMPPMPDNGVKQVAQNLKEILASVKNQETVPTKKVAEGHESVAKTEKAAKTEGNEAKPVGMAGNSVVGDAQKVVAVPLVAPSDEGKEHEVSASVDDALSSVGSATSRQSAAMTPVTNSKTDKKSAGAGKADGDNTKAVVSASADDPVEKKSGTDAEKIANTAAKVTDSDNAEPKSTLATGATTTGVTHAEPGLSTGAFGGIPLSAAMHAATAKAQTTEVNSHPAPLQAGSGAIDMPGSIDETHKTLMATPTALEVGVANGTHGWLKIRAEMTGGGVVNASLSTANSSGQEMLHRELPSLTAYLQSERVAVNAVVVQPTVVAGADGRGLAGGMNGDGSGQAQQSGNQGGENRQGTANTVLSRVEKDVPYNGPNGVGGDESLLPGSYANGGSWLSVRA